MGAARYVVLGLAPVRTAWFAAVAQWANAASLPVDFVKCLSAEELRARLASTRPYSAVLVDGGLPALDRDMIDAGTRAGCPVIVVEERRSRRDWVGLGARAVILGPLDRDALLEVLRQHATTLSRLEAGDEAEVASLASGTGLAEGTSTPGGRGLLVAVGGAGGTGGSTLAMAVAQGLAGSPGLAGGRSVVLADLALRADQAVLHDARDVVPGVQELVEAHRNGSLESSQVVAMTYEVAERGYHLLLGLRRASAWASIRPRAFEAALTSLGRTYDVVVGDIETDLEGADEGGSVDVEERNAMARTTAVQADVVLAVGLPGVKGVHSLVRVVRELAGAGVAPERIVAVFNRSPKARRAQAGLAGALGQLVAQEGTGLAAPVFVPERRLDDLAGPLARLPGALADPLVAAVVAVVARSGTQPGAPGQGRRVAPGRLGHWQDDEEPAVG